MSIKCLDQVLACICPGPSRSKLKLEIANYVIKKGRKEKIGAYDESNINSNKMLNKILDVLFTVLSKSKHASIEKRVLRPILGKTLKKRFLQSKCEKYGIMDITSGSIVSRIKEDFDALMN